MTKDNQPFFSIILPTRNNAEYLKGAIATVLNQDFDDYELIVSNNFADDNTEEVVKSFNSKHLKYVKTDRLYYYNGSWNFALSHTTGKYILMIGDDDGVMKDGLKKLKDEIIEQNYPDLISQPIVRYIIDQNRFNFRQYHTIEENNIKAAFERTLRGEIIVQAALHLVFKKEIIPDHKLYSIPYPDYSALPKLLYWSKNIYYSKLYVVIHGHMGKSAGSIFDQKDFKVIKKGSLDFAKAVDNLIPFKVLFHSNGYFASMKKALQELGLRKDIDWHLYFSSYHANLNLMKSYGNDIQSDLDNYYKELAKQPILIQLKVRVRIFLRKLKYFFKKPSVERLDDEITLDGTKYDINNIVDLSNLTEDMIVKMKKDLQS